MKKISVFWLLVPLFMVLTFVALVYVKTQEVTRSWGR
jgi:hypothetical protein